MKRTRHCPRRQRGSADRDTRRDLVRSRRIGRSRLSTTHHRTCNRKDAETTAEPPKSSHHFHQHNSRPFFERNTQLDIHCVHRMPTQSGSSPFSLALVEPIPTRRAIARRATSIRWAPGSSSFSVSRKAYRKATPPRRGSETGVARRSIWVGNRSRNLTDTRR